MIKICFFTLSVSLALNLRQTKNDTIDLKNYHKDNYSQTGENGIIEKIFSVIEPTSFYAVEIGAWDVFYIVTQQIWKSKGG